MALVLEYYNVKCQETRDTQVRLAAAAWAVRIPPGVVHYLQYYNGIHI